MKRDRRSQFWHLTAYWCLGGIGLALVSLVCFRLGLSPDQAGYAYLILVVLLAPTGGIAGAVVFSLAAAACLIYFCAPPLFSFRTDDPEDIAVIAAILTTSLVVTGLMAKTRKAADDAEASQRAQRESEEHWRDIFEHNPVMYFMVDASGTVLSMNASGATQLGYTVSELVGQSVANVFFEEDRELVLDKLNACLARLGQSVSWEARKCRKDRTVLWVRENAKAVRREGNRLIVLIACEDITERKRAEDAVRTSEERWRNLFEHVPVGVALTNAQGNYVAANPAFQRMVGYSEAELRSRSALDITHESDRAATEAVLEARANGEPYDQFGEKRYRRKDGAVICAEVNVFAVPTAGSLPFFAVVAVDITDRKRAEDDLRRSEAQLAEAQRVSKTGSFRWCVATGEINWSEETYRIFEVDRWIKPTVELVFERAHPDDRASVQHLVARKSEEHQDWKLEHRLLMPSGAVKHVRVVAHAAKDEVGQLEFIGAIMDVTAAKLAEEELHKAQMELAHVTRVTTLGELAASIAHEVNQPLAAVVANAEACLLWLDRGTPNLAEARRSVEWIIKDGNRAGEVIRRVRTLSNKTDTHKAPLDINDVIGEAAALVQRELLSHRVSLWMELGHALPAVLADRIQLQQVIINLMINGVEAMQPITNRPRKLTIRSHQEQVNQVLVTVKDCGVGIATEITDRLFDAFFTTKSSGMGMGLSICRSIIEAHGGRLWAEPNLPHGAIFHLVLPSYQEDAS